MKIGNMKAIGRWLIALSIACSAAISARAEDAPPDVLVRQTTDELLAVLRSDKDIRAGNVARLVQLIEEKVTPHFDFERMTRLAVGRPWREASPTQREALVREFHTLLVRSYSTAFTDYTGITVEYRPYKMKSGDTDATVQTLIKLPGGAPPMDVDYELGHTADGWKVYDVRVAGASLIINYRNVFAQEIQNGGIDGLIKSLVDKNSGKIQPMSNK